LCSTASIWTNDSMRMINLIKERIQALSIKQKRITLVALVLGVALCVIVSILVSGNSVKGKYDFSSIVIDGDPIYMSDSGYMNILGVDNNKKSTFYIELGDHTARLKGYVYTIQKNKGYTTYKFDVVAQSGTALEDVGYFKFLFYPDRGVLEVKGLGATLYFLKK